MKARTRVATAILAFAALPLIVANGVGLQERRHAAAKTADLQLSGNASELSALLAASRTRWLESVRADAGLPGVEAMLSRDPPPDPVRVSRFFAAVGSRDTVNIHAIGLLDLKGRVLEDSRVVRLGRNESGEPWVDRVLATGQPQLIGPLTPRGDPAPGLFVAALIREADGTPRGLLRIRLEPSVLGQVMDAALVASPGLSATLLDDRGERLLGVGDAGESPLALPRLPLAGPARVLDIGDERVALAPVERSGWWLAVRQPREAWSAPQSRLTRDWLLQTGLMLGVLLAAALWLGGRIAAPLVRYSAAARRMADGDFGPVPRWPGAEEARQLSEALDTLAMRLRGTISSLEHELAQRREAESALRDSREEYLALVERLPGVVYRCANREGWPMDYLSPQVARLTGYTAAELLVDDGTAFGRLVHEDDLVLTSRVLEEAREGVRSFELRYRIHHADGRIRWVWELGAVHADASGEPAVVTGMLFDITAQQALEQAMAVLRDTIEARIGGDFFAALASGLARVLDAEAAMIGRYLGDPPTQLDALALVDRGGRSQPTTFPLDGTPSAAVHAAGRLDVGDGVQARFPGDAALAERGIRAYVGRRLDDRDGRPIGVLAIFDTKPRRTEEDAALLDLFQVRAAAELERAIAGEDLRRLADTLETRVAERTRELEAANASLSQAMEQLVQREKLASLGNLVAGIAHELNTPIGNALTVASALHEAQQAFAQAFASGPTTRGALERLLADNAESASLVERNLQRAATLISHFKQVAVDQASVRRRRFDLAEVVEEVVSTLSPRLKRTAHVVELAIPPGLVFDSYPGPLEQVLTNLIENSLVHAFATGHAGRITIRAEADGDRVRLQYEDDGQGIPATMRHRVFDPFFTSKLGQGGSGLGLYLVYNLVTGHLGGSIRLLDRARGGACFVLDLPRVVPERDEDPGPQPPRVDASNTR